MKAVMKINDENVLVLCLSNFAFYVNGWRLLKLSHFKGNVGVSKNTSP